MRSGDFAVLATLARLAGEDLSQRRLAAELGLSAGTVSLRIDRLTQRGLARRRSDPDDRRGALISLTDQGRRLFEACAPEHLTNAQDLLAGLTHDERDDLGRLLGKLLYTLEDADPGDAFAPELGLVVDDAPVALQRRRAVGLPALAGLLVRHVEPAGLAAAGGVRPGDLLISANRRPLRTRRDLREQLIESERRRRPLELEIARGTEPIQLSLAAPNW